VPPSIKREEPPYLQVARHLQERIERGDLRPGDRVPSEREIADQWGVSRATATKVLGALRTAGLVEARRGSGTVVRSAAGLSDFQLQCQDSAVLVVHLTCMEREPVSTLRDAATWAEQHRCP
jgi:DNA-binding GntR family transcriptional regulator